MKKVLYIGDYYKGAIKYFPRDEWSKDIISSLESTGLAEVYWFAYDKHWYDTQRRGDAELLENIKKIQPDLIVFKLYKAPSSIDCGTPIISTFIEIKKMGIKTVAIWGDLASVEERFVADSLKKYIDVYVGTQSKETCDLLDRPAMQLHYPKDGRVFNNPNITRDLDVVFNGSIKGRKDREDLFIFLRANNISVDIKGGVDNNAISTAEYANRYQRAKMSISFSNSAEFTVISARSWEVMLCGSLLFEQKNPELARLFISGVDFIEWTDEVDLLQKIRYYLEHEDERALIASNGHKRTVELYSDKTFWSKVLDK
jgi:hypothetical protein